ncbi:MAG TPA: tetratricopeptide repeat protein [Prolixibacteraceae bacterium]|nr:tetratricopeptide repeat protein [Prolixibacteraceae bacterium]
MKRYFILILLLSGFAVNGQNAEQLLEQANQHYLAQEFQQAASLYEQILSSGKESAQVYFNLGNAYYKTGDMNRAILNYERARLLAPQDEDIAFNLRMANQYVVDNIEELPQPFFLRWRTTLVNRASSGAWARLSAGSFILFLLMAGLFLFSRTTGLKRIGFWTGVVVLLFSVLSFSFASRQQKLLRERNHAIVFCPRVTVKSSPSQAGTDLFLIHEGLKVQITNSLNNWKEVKLADGNKGWLPDSCLVKI